MEKEIWVECMNNTTGALEFLTIGKHYLATIKDDFTYVVKNDKGVNDWFSKERFKVIGINDELWVECIDDFSLHAKDLTVGKIYKVKEIPSDKNCYLVQNDSGKEFYHSKSKFKPVDKTSILRIIKTDMKSYLRKIVGNSVVNVGFFSKITTCDKIEILIEDNTSGIVTDVYTLSTTFDDKILDKANLILKEYDIKLELEQQQPKFKINCDKLYTKEEAEKLKESGIDLVEIK